MHPPNLLLTNPAAWKSLSLEMLWVYRGIAPNPLRWSQEITVPAGVFFVIRGAVKIRAGGQEIACPPGTAFFSAPSARQQYFKERTELLSVGFRAEWPQPAPVFRDGLNRVVEPPHLGPLKQATTRLYRTAHGTRRQATHTESLAPLALPLDSRCVLEAVFLQWFAEYTRTLHRLGIEPAPQPVARDARVLAAQQRLDEWPGDAPFRRATLMRGLPVGVRRLEQIFRAELGTTPHAYLERRRLEIARERLAIGTLSMKEIAYALGFRHASHFTIWFRRLTGETPKAFRDRSRIGGL